LAFPDHKESRDQKGIRVAWDHLDHKDYKDRKGIRVAWDHKGLLDHKDRLDHLDQRAIQRQCHHHKPIVVDV
jgi:hypothetical protein